MGFETKVRWELAGLRTSKWRVNYLAIENLGFEGHRERLRQVTRADASSWGIQEHFQVSMALRHTLLVDQLDPYNLLSIEIQFRRLQTIEYSYSEKAKDLEAKAVGGRLSLEEQTTCGGIARQYSTLVICPQLLGHVKIETEKEQWMPSTLCMVSLGDLTTRGMAGRAMGPSVPARLIFWNLLKMHAGLHLCFLAQRPLRSFGLLRGTMTCRLRAPLDPSILTLSHYRLRV